MADANTSLPVRTQNAGDVIAKLSDATTPSQQLAINSSGAASVTFTALGSASGGTAGTSSDLSGGIYNATALTLTTGQQASLQLNSSGYLLVALASSTATQAVNLTQVGGSAIALGQTTMSGSLPVTIASNQSNLNVTVATALPAGSNTIGAVTQGTTPWVDNITQIGGAALALGQTTMSASLPVTFASNQSTLNVLTTAQGTVSAGTAGTTSMLGGLVYNSTAPTLTTGQQAALQGDASANLKVNLATALPTGTNSIGNIGTVSTVTAVTAITNALPSGSNTIGAVTQASGPWTQNLTQVLGAAPSATNALATQIATSGAYVSVSNPLPVTISSSTPGTPVQDYHTSAALAAGSSVTFTYTVVAAHTFSLERVWASASGKIKAVVQNNGSTIMVGFNSTATPNIDMTIVAPPTIAAGNTATVTITNDDILPFDVYCTIEGNQN